MFVVVTIYLASVIKQNCKPGFPILSTTDILGHIILCCGGRCVLCRMVSSISIVCTPDARGANVPLVVATKNVSKHCWKTTDGRKKSPLCENHWYSWGTKMAA